MLLHVSGWTTLCRPLPRPRPPLRRGPRLRPLLRPRRRWETDEARRVQARGMSGTACEGPSAGGANTVEMLAGIITNGLWCLAPFDPAFCGTISRVLGASFLSGGVAQRQSRGLISPVSEVQFLPPPPPSTGGVV